MMERMACFQKIAAARDGAIVVATYTSAFEWHRVDPNPLNFVSVGAMGQASAHALGLALGLPNQKIIWKFQNALHIHMRKNPGKNTVKSSLRNPEFRQVQNFMRKTRIC